MKFAIIIPDGCADEPQPSLDGKTPLEAADVSHMDQIAKLGIVGRSNNVPRHLPAGSAVANLSLFGYDPNKYFTGRAPLEAAAQRIQLGPEDWAIRCNLVTIHEQIMNDFTAGHITTEEAHSLIRSLQDHLQTDTLEFVPGVSYRNLLIYRSPDGRAPFSRQTVTTPPHDLTDKSVLDHFPRGPGCDLLTNLMSQSIDLFSNHAINLKRRQAGQREATNIWLWGLGKRPDLPSFRQRFHVDGAMITAVDLLRGIATLIGWNLVEVPGATGYTDTDYAAKGRYAVQALDSADVVCVHVEATDEASHEGDVAAKIKALEQIDEQIVGPVYASLQQRGDFRILISPDHPTPIRTKTHSHGDVPWTIAGTDISPDSARAYNESTAAASQQVFGEGHQLMDFFMNKQTSQELARE